MICSRCKAQIPQGEEMNYNGETLCEDCYMDQMFRPKACDPWAVYTAKSFERHSKEVQLTPLQERILAILEEEGPMEPSTLLEKINSNLTLKDLEREFAILRHLERVRGEKRGDKVFFRLW